MKNFISYIVFLILLLLTACGNKQNAPNADPLENNSTVIDYGKEDHNVSRDADVCIEREESHASNIVSYFVEERSNGIYEYDVYSNHIVITSVTQIGSDGKLSIPSEIDGLPVLAIDNTESPNSGFKSLDNLSSLKTLVISDGVEYIGYGAFSRCYNLQSVTIPDSVLGIGSGAFFDTPWLDSQINEFVIVGDGILLKYNGNDPVVHIPTEVKYVSTAFVQNRPIDIGDKNLNETLTEVFIPDSVTALGMGAFAGCAYLQDVHFPNSLQEIGVAAFAGCTSLTNIQLPSGLTELGAEAFYGCTTLANVDVPLSVSVVGASAFSGTPFMKNCTSEFQIIGDGVMISYNGNDADIIIPDGVKSIACGSSGLCGRKEIHTVTMPDTVTYIGDEAFSDCRCLHRISFSGNLEYIGDLAFYLCEKLQPIILPDSVEYIGESAFRGCDSLTSFRIPEQLREIKAGTFIGCNRLTTIYLPPSAKSVAPDAFDGCDIFMYCCEEGSAGYEYAMEKVNYPSPCVALKQADGTFLNESMSCGMLCYVVYDNTLHNIKCANYEAILVDDEVSAGPFLSGEEYTYDKYGNVTSYTKYDANREIVRHSESEYNSDGLCVKSFWDQTPSDSQKYTLYEYSSDENILRTLTYNQNDILIEECLYDDNGGWKKTSTYNAEGNLCQIKEREQVNNQSFIYTYDADGNLVDTRPYN